MQEEKRDIIHIGFEPKTFRQNVKHSQFTVLYDLVRILYKREKSR